MENGPGDGNDLADFLLFNCINHKFTYDINLLTLGNAPGPFKKLSTIAFKKL